VGGIELEIMKKPMTLSALTAFLLLWSLFPLVGGSAYGEKVMQRQSREIGMAVEFMDHAACAFIARDKGWFAEEGITVPAYESYITGMALASAFARGDIQIAYLCLVPAIHVYANAKVPLKIIAGTHKYGYGLVVNSDKIKTVQELQKPGIRIGSVREGGAVDVLLHRVLEKYGLEKGMLLNRVQRMNPPKQVLAIKNGLLDAAFLPEQWATMAEGLGFTMLLTAQDVWPHMQGSVLVVTEELIGHDPELIRRLVKVTQKATAWIIKNPTEAAAVVARQLSITGEKVFPVKATKIAANLEISPQILLKSMHRLEYSLSIAPDTVQETIDYLAHLGYIKNSFRAHDILDLRFLQ
jgi:NitT/TauT family transport system substrate-binding protein